MNKTFEELIAERQGLSLEQYLENKRIVAEQERMEYFKDNILDLTTNFVFPAIIFLLVFYAVVKIIKKELLTNNPDKKSSKKISENTTNVLVREISEDTILYMKANEEVKNKMIDYDTYGLIKENPIFTCMVDGSERYLSRLTTDKKELLTYKRIGSTSAGNINGMIDIYELYLNKKLNKTIYLNMYSTENSKIAPKGFLIRKENTL